MRSLVLALVLGLAGCAALPPPKPPVPARYDLTVVVTSRDVRLPGAVVTIDGQAFPVNAFGWMGTEVTPGVHAVRVTKDGYDAVDQSWTITRHTRKVVGLNRSGGSIP